MSLFKTLSKVFTPKDGASRTPTKSPDDHAQAKKTSTRRIGKKRIRLESRPLKQSIQKKENANSQKQADGIVREAEAKAREIIIEAKSDALKLREEADVYSQKVRDAHAKKQQDLSTKEHELDRKEAVLQEKERFLDRIEKEVQGNRSEVEALKKRLIDKLEEIGGLTRDEARKQILEAVQSRSSKDIARIIKEAEEKAHEEADQKVQDILVDAMKHGATDYVAEYTVSTVELPSEDIKGRLIGKEGRNIRAFERATGVDLDLDETPGLVRLSSFDSVRREIARVALKRLVRDGRIQPTRIEEYVERAQKDIERVMFEEGKKLCHAVGAFNVPHDLIGYLGRFKFRSSYGQNMIAHTLEETKMGIKLASELKANVDTVRLGCLFHDIGKVVTDEEGSHVELGVKLLKKYNMPQPVIDAVAQHHEDIPFTSNESVIVYIADAISGARPGARLENYDDYVKRLETMETIAMENNGVTEAYAIQAGRELRVIVNHKELKDEEVVILADKIRDRIKNEMTYPGTVTVNVIREIRATAVAK